MLSVGSVVVPFLFLMLLFCISSLFFLGQFHWKFVNFVNFFKKPNLDLADYSIFVFYYVNI